MVIFGVSSAVFGGTVPMAVAVVSVLSWKRRSNPKSLVNKVVITELDDNKENIPPTHHNQFNTVMNLQFVDYPSSNGNVGMTAVLKTDENEENKENDATKLTKVKKEDEEESTQENKQQKKTKPIVVNTVSDEDLEEFFRVFDDLIPMYRSSTQLQEVIFETSQKEWNEWCYKVEQCEEETHSWLDARIMFYSRRIIEYQKDWAEYWNKKRQKEKEMLELTSDLSSDGLCPNTPSSTSMLPDSIKLLGSSPLPPFSLTAGTAVNNYIPFQTPDESASSMLTSIEATPTKATVNTNTNAALSNLLMGTEDIDLTSFSLDSNQDLLSNMPILYDTSNGQSCYPNLDYNLDSTSSFDSLDPLSNATINNDYCNWLSSNPSSSLSMDDILFNTTTPSDPNYSLLLNSAAATAASTIPSVTSSLNFLNPLAATTASLNPALSIFDTNYTTSATTTDNLLIPPNSLVKLPTVSSTASLIDSFANLNPNQDSGKEGESEEGTKNEKKDDKLEEEKEEKGKEGESGKETKKAELATGTTVTEPLADTDMTTLLTNDLGLDLLFQDSTETTATAMGTVPPKTAEETPKMTIKTVTDALITPTKPKDFIPPTVDFFVDTTTNGNKKTSEFATPLYIKPPAMDTFSAIPKSYQEMYNDKMYSLISTLERCVQDKEDFWKVMEEFTSSINTHASPAIAC